MLEKDRIERFSNVYRKTNTKAIALTNRNRTKQHDEPITIPSISCISLAQTAHTRCDWLRFCFSLVEKLAREF